MRSANFAFLSFVAIRLLLRNLHLTESTNTHAKCKHVSALLFALLACHSNPASRPNYLRRKGTRRYETFPAVVRMELKLDVPWSDFVPNLFGDPEAEGSGRVDIRDHAPAGRAHNTPSRVQGLRTCPHPGCTGIGHIEIRKWDEDHKLLRNCPRRKDKHHLLGRTVDVKWDDGTYSGVVTKIGRPTT